MSGPWIKAFLGLESLPRDFQDRLVRDSRVLTLPEGTRLFGPGQAPSNYLLLLGGSIRVQQVSANGREIVLYRITAGESCVLTTACLLGYEDYRAEAIAESAIEAVAIPRATFDDLISRSSAFRQFVFKSFSDRITDLCRVIDEIAFLRLDIRLAQKLVQLKNAKDEVEATHQQLATELGTAREVVSRQLNEFQRRGWLKSGRGVIQIAADSPLYDFARHHA